MYTESWMSTSSTPYAPTYIENIYIKRVFCKPKHYLRKVKLKNFYFYVDVYVFFFSPVNSLHLGMQNMMYSTYCQWVYEKVSMKIYKVISRCIRIYGTLWKIVTEFFPGIIVFYRGVLWKSVCFLILYIWFGGTTIGRQNWLQFLPKKTFI